MVPKQTRSAIVLVLAVLVGLSVAQASGILSSPVAADNHFMIQNLATRQSNNVIPVLQVQPSSRIISAGSYAQFEINVDEEQSTSVLLISRGVPLHSVAIFTPENGLANPSFNSSLTIVTSPNSPAGTYNITVLATANGQAVTADVSLQIMSTITNSSVNVPENPSLSVKVESDQNYYRPNETVNVQGYVTDGSGNAVAGAEVSVQADSSAGSELVFMTDLTTNAAGGFQALLTIPTNATAGTYTVFAAASKSGYTSATTHTNFVINSSVTPSVMIVQVYTTDATNNPSAVFSMGQTVLIWVVLQNIGAPIQGVIWIQILDPRGTLVSIQLQISTLTTGGIVKVAFGYTPPPNSLQGIYSANALASDKLISQGGTFLANGNAQFLLAE